jgi:GNAT superfamily N-acetyltransferase
VTGRITIRPAARGDYPHWRPLWEGYNAFYGREGANALPEDITHATWERFFAPAEAMHCRVAESNGQLVGLAHFLYHRSTSRLAHVCYLQDLFTAPPLRGQGIAGELIAAVYAAAQAAACSRVYWHTQAGNAAGRALYDKVGVHQGFIVYSHEL